MTTGIRAHLTLTRYPAQLGAEDGWKKDSASAGDGILDVMGVLGEEVDVRNHVLAGRVGGRVLLGRGGKDSMAAGGANVMVVEDVRDDDDRDDGNKARLDMKRSVVERREQGCMQSVSWRPMMAASSSSEVELVLGGQATGRC